MANKDRASWQHMSFYMKLGIALLVISMVSGSMAVNRLTFSGPQIDLRERIPLSSGRERTGRQVRFAVATMHSPASTFTHYQGMVELIGQRLDMTSLLIIRPDYQAIRRVLLAGEVDAALVSSGTYAMLHDSPRIEMLVMPQLLPDTQYRGEIVVATESPYHKLADLRAKRFAYTDAESSTGYFLPRQLLRQHGYDPESFFEKVFHTGSHDLAVRAVINGYADGAAVSSQVLAGLFRQQPHLKDRLRIVASSAGHAPPPVLIPSNLAPGLKKQMQQVLLSMHEDSDGRAALARVGLARFVPPEPELYLSLVELHKAELAERGRLP